MSLINGDKSRSGIQRKKKMAKRLKMRAMVAAVTPAPAAGTPVAKPNKAKK